MASGIVHIDFIPPLSPPIVYPTSAPSSLNGGTASPAPAPNMVPPPVVAARVSFTPAAPAPVRTTYVSPVTTQRQINTFFRIVDARLNAEAE